MKYIITESQYNRFIDKFLTYQFEPHEEKTSENYPYSIFWIKKGKVIVEIEKSRYFWVERNIWGNISSIISLEHDEIISVIIHWLKKHYNLEGLTPKSIHGASSPRWQDIIIL